ncbi:MAG: hypothetical protein ABI852_11665 [Gemmatimonadaceae bacterium]
MKHISVSQFASFTRGIGLLATAALTAACSEGATEPDLAPTSFVNIVVSCDAAVLHDGSQWRVNYCTLALDGGMIGGSLIMPGAFSAEKRSALQGFATCMNRKTSTEQQRCYAMLEG